MGVSPMVAESGRTALGLARALSSDDAVQAGTAVGLIMSMPRKELECVTSALASLLAGMVMTHSHGWDAVNAEMEKRITS